MFLPWLFFILDWLPFLPFWWLLALLYGLAWVIKGEGKSRYYGGAICLLVLASPFFFNTRPKLSLAGLGLVFLGFIGSFLWFFFKRLKGPLSPSLNRLYRFAKGIFWAALLGAVLITWAFHRPAVLVWRLGLYPSSLAEKWLEKPDPAVYRALARGLKTGNPRRESAMLRILGQLEAKKPLPDALKPQLAAYFSGLNADSSEETLCYAVILIDKAHLPEGRDLIERLKKTVSPKNRFLYFPR